MVLTCAFLRCIIYRREITQKRLCRRRYKMDLTLQLGIAAGVLQLVAFALYNKQILQGTSTPNTATWTLWAFLAVLNASSYAAMTADLAKYFLPITSALA